MWNLEAKVIEEKKVQPWIKTTLEMGPVVLFFIGYVLINAVFVFFCWFYFCVFELNLLFFDGL